MEKSKIERLIECLRMALSETEAKYNELDIERIALVVYDSMSSPGRIFHNVWHIFDVSQNLNGVSVLAAIFHDVVYYQVDQGFRPGVEVFVNQVVKAENGKYTLIEFNDDLYKKLLILFERKIGDELHIGNGLNEFLSAYISINLLKGLLVDEEILKVAALIETTIPFRTRPIEKLEERLLKIGFKEETVLDICEKAVDFSNSDVSNFSGKDPKKFLNNTWDLISETNYSLRRGGENFTVIDYRDALYKTYSFFEVLDPSLVFCRFKNYPNNERWESLNNGATFNVEIGRRYLAVQLVSVAAIESIVELTGGNIPMSLIMGDIRRRDQKKIRMEDYLGEPIDKKNNINSNLIALFEEGRSHESSFDMKGSPLSAYIYRSIGDNESEKIFLQAKEYFSGKINAEAMIKAFPRNVILRIIKACAEVSSTRRSRLIHLQNSI